MCTPLHLLEMSTVANCYVITTLSGMFGKVFPYHFMCINFYIFNDEPLIIMYWVNCAVEQITSYVSKQNILLHRYTTIYISPSNSFCEHNWWLVTYNTFHNKFMSCTSITVPRQLASRQCFHLVFKTKLCSICTLCGSTV